MDAPADLVVDFEEDLGISKLRPEHDQRKSVIFRHLELISYDETTRIHVPASSTVNLLYSP